MTVVHTYKQWAWSLHKAGAELSTQTSPAYVLLCQATK